MNRKFREQGGLLKEIASQQSHLYRISQAVHWLQQHYQQPLDVHALAEQQNMSISSFYSHFRQLVGLSPLQYQKQLRLLEAQKWLRQESTTISQIAYQVGYDSLSQFSREYKRQFGLSPRDERTKK